MRSIYGDWLNLAVDGWRLAAESQTVIALRMMKLAAGDGAAAAEAQLMIHEKILAAGEAQSQMIADAMTGSAHLAPRRALAHYRRKVRANRRRLTR
ncbi:MAG: hypothetical protein JWP50_1877 [Phenylobacterium sp.]|nr:hypothetical protein [Phenylobacterium sp.]